ncbi:MULTISPECIES: hypothetical protein [unclassified Sphingomonas]|uniref:hypothetical protein n=1 Tax=unclassified Sphingomonas TaxID=196159 RepID=UPI001F59C6AE|nr:MULTISPECIES: hypothetical protein [unclassified Sphingomonas]
MSMRISSALALALSLAACGTATRPDNRALAAAEANQQTEAADDGRIACAHGDAAMAHTCTVDQLQGDHGLELTVRNADGGFHRLLVTRDGRGVIAADGAEPAKVTVRGPAEIEVAIGADRYRLPATVKGATAK